MKIFLIAILGTLLGLLPGCSSKPSATKVYPSPISTLSVVEADFDGDGPMSADTTRVYAVRKSGGNDIKQLIVEGEYLGLSQVEWKSADQLELTVSPDSRTSSFFNNVTLSDGKTSMKVHTTLLQSPLR